MSSKTQSLSLKEFEKELAKITPEEVAQIRNSVLEGRKEKNEQIEKMFNYKSPRRKQLEKENLELICEIIRK